MSQFLDGAERAKYLPDRTSVLNFQSFDFNPDWKCTVSPGCSQGCRHRNASNLSLACLEHTSGDESSIYGI